MENLNRPLPKPITPEVKPFWDGLKEHKLMLPKCDDCGKPFFYPRILCPFCHSRRISWIQASGKGKLHAFEIAYQSFNPEFKIPPPYILAMIELEEGPRLMSNLINIEPDPAVIRCDMPVEVVFEKLTDEITLPLFQPAR
ncbi:MAG: Zn-ribbon domain-containing OB-fold protein [Nitrospinota bacterium]|nr:MAG: Zn-ribbon domain-containing OB-fold protein [Nitrospinota bacterium]